MYIEYAVMYSFFAFIVLLVLLNYTSKYKTYRAYVNYVAIFDNIGVFYSFQYCYEVPSTGETHKFSLMYSRSASEFANI